jgi:8-oxo-dGTP pyrophosphatase MutT (NUDIX family)
MSARGGRQRIPRPPTFRPGGPAPWTRLPPERRRFSLADVRVACERLPPPRHLLAPATSTPAAVLVPCFEEDGEARIILTKRPDTMPSHQGEIAFPGGKHDPDVDEDLRATALREAREEIALDPTQVEIVAELDGIATVASRFTLTPFVGLLPARPTVTPDPTEVVSVFDVAISELLEDAAYREEMWDVPPELGPGVGRNRAIHFFELEDETVWGATARILAAFLEHLTRDR